MKISIVLRDITEKGGGERVCANLANALSQFYDVKIISFYQSQPQIAYPLNPAIQTYFLRPYGEKSGGKIKALFRRVFYRYLLSMEAKKIFFQDDIVLANDRALAPIKKIKAQKYIRLWHLHFPKRRRNLSFFDALVVLSSKELDKWKSIHSNVWVIPNFLPNFPESQTDYTQKTFLSVGRMDRGDPKGFLRLIDIFALVAKKYPDWKLVIIGEGVLKQELENKIQQDAMQSQVVLKPFTTQIIQEYLKASFYVMTSYSEGLPMVLLESASCGLGSIAFDIASGPSDIIQDQKTGFLVKDGDLQDFASKIEKMIEDISLRATMGEEASSRVKKHFSQEVILEKWKELFFSLKEEK